MSHFASQYDFDHCMELERHYGTSYYLATRRFPRYLRMRTYAIYGFVRIPDEWVDNPEGKTPAEIEALLDSYEQELCAGLEGECPESPVLRAFIDVIREANIPLEEVHLFLNAMRQDLTTSRYETWEDLLGYMRGSAAAVGLMMCAGLDVQMDEELRQAACDLANAMQLTNFLRDVGEDVQRGRIYLPLEDLRQFGVTEAEILEGQPTEKFVELMRFEIARARRLYEDSDKGIARLPQEVRRPVRIARILYSRILDRIEAQNYNVFTKRARTGRLEKLWVAAREWFRHS